MEKNTIFKTIGFVGFVFGAGTMAIASYNRYKRKEDEVITVDALVKAEIITQNFSGANGVKDSLECVRIKKEMNGVYKALSVNPTDGLLMRKLNALKLEFEKSNCSGSISPISPTTNCSDILQSITNTEERLKSYPNDRNLLKKLAQLNAQLASMGCKSKSAAHLCTDGKRTWFSSKPCNVIGVDDAVGRMAGDYCKVGRGKGHVVGSDGIYQPDGHGGLECVPSATSRKINLKNNPIPTGAGFASVDSRLK